jgi:hypothetical protein
VGFAIFGRFGKNSFHGRMNAPEMSELKENLAKNGQMVQNSQPLSPWCYILYHSIVSLDERGITSVGNMPDKQIV